MTACRNETFGKWPEKSGREKVLQWGKGKNDKVADFTGPLPQGALVLVQIGLPQTGQEYVTPLPSRVTEEEPVKQACLKRLLQAFSGNFRNLHPAYKDRGVNHSLEVTEV